MKRTWTIIGVSNVPSIFKWYQSLFGQPKTPPDHDDFVKWLKCSDPVIRQASESNTRYAMTLRICELLISVTSRTK